MMSHKANCTKCGWHGHTEHLNAWTQPCWSDPLLDPTLAAFSFAVPCFKLCFYVFLDRRSFHIRCAAFLFSMVVSMRLNVRYGRAIHIYDSLGSKKNMAIEGETFLLNLPSSWSPEKSSRENLSLLVKKLPLSTFDRNFGLIWIDSTSEF